MQYQFVDHFSDTNFEIEGYLNEKLEHLAKCSEIDKNSLASLYKSGDLIAAKITCKDP